MLGCTWVKMENTWKKWGNNLDWLESSLVTLVSSLGLLESNWDWWASSLDLWVSTMAMLASTLDLLENN